MLIKLNINLTKANQYELVQFGLNNKTDCENNNSSLFYNHSAIFVRISPKEANGQYFHSLTLPFANISY